MTVARSINLTIFPSNGMVNMKQKDDVEMLHLLHVYIMVPNMTVTAVTLSNRPQHAKSSPLSLARSGHLVNGCMMLMLR